MKKHEILMIVENSYPLDIRVRKEAESLQRSGYQVNVLAMKEKGQKYNERINGVRVTRIPAIPKFRIGQYIYFMDYAYITVVGLAFFLLSHPFRRYRVIHVHNPPDTLFIIGFVGKLLEIGRDTLDSVLQCGRILEGACLSLLQKTGNKQKAAL